MNVFDTAVLILVCLHAMIQAPVIAAPHTSQPQRVEQLEIPLPLTESSICSLATLWGGITRRLVGVECVWAPPSTGAGVGQVVNELDLSGTDVQSSLDLMLAHLPSYFATIESDIVIFRPATSRTSASQSFLDRVIPQFTLNNASLVQAAELLNRLFDPTYRVLDQPLGKQIHASSEKARELGEVYIARYNERFRPAIAVHLSNVRVEEILNAVARQANASWRVQCSSVPSRYEDCTR